MVASGARITTTIGTLGCLTRMPLAYLFPDFQENAECDFFQPCLGAIRRPTICLIIVFDVSYRSNNQFRARNAAPE